MYVDQRLADAFRVQNGKQDIDQNSCSSSEKDSNFFVKVKITKIIIFEILNSRIFRNSARYSKKGTRGNCSI